MNKHFKKTYINVSGVLPGSSSPYTVKAPSDWSSNAISIFVSKYMCRAAVPAEKDCIKLQEPGILPLIAPTIEVKEGAVLGAETDFRQVFDRLAATWTYHGVKQGVYDLEEQEQVYAEIVQDLEDQRWAPNSPQWFNTGTYHKYRIITSSSVHFQVPYDFDETQKVVASTTNAHPQLSACFIQSIEDNLVDPGGIFDLVLKEASLFKYGSGTGTNFSKIRAKGESLTCGGISSGIMSFLDILDKTASAIKSGGTTRRAAKMVILDVDHPEIEDFVTWKTREEYKVAALVAGSNACANLLTELKHDVLNNTMDEDSVRVLRTEYAAKAEALSIPKELVLRVLGMPLEDIKSMDPKRITTDWEGDAYRTVSGQNSNNSVRVSDAFMEAVKNDTEWHLIGRRNGKPIKTLRARKLWEQICQSAWSCADPGIQFDTTINKWNTAAETDTINASNPCSEYMFLDNTACNLASINLMKFRGTGIDFDYPAFQETCRRVTKVLEVSVGLGAYPSKEIAENSFIHRTLGLGYANLGSLLMSYGYPYDSAQARRVCEEITHSMQYTAIATSCEMAKKLGPCLGYKGSKTVKSNAASFLKVLAQQFPDPQDRDLYEMVKAHGVRNMQHTVLAPTGTIGLVMDCDTTGIEPDFSLVKFKSLAGGGYMQFVNQTVVIALQTLGYLEDQIKEILAYIEETMTIEGAPHIQDQHLAVFDCANKCGSKGTRYIAPEGHLRMMAAAQAYISGAISKTVNLPNSCTINDVSNIYTLAHSLGLKAVALYRDGCKFSQPLSTSNTEVPIEAPTTKPQSMNRSVRRQLPSYRKGYTQKATIAGHNLYLTTGEYANGELGEIFLSMSKEGTTFTSILNCFAVSISIGLQYGVPLERFVESFTFSKFEPNGVVHGHENIKLTTSIIDYIFKDLAIKYLDRKDLSHIPPQDDAQSMNPPTSDMEKARQRGYESQPCAACQSWTMVRNGTCLKCTTCGETSGCS